jgi:DNA-binding response OmpR family regulator
MERRDEEKRPLQGMRILVVDDEFLIATNIEMALSDAGAEVVSVSTISAALLGAEAEILSAAILDYRLGRRTTEAVADILAGRGVPFIFHSGQALPDDVRARYPNVRVLPKPIGMSAFVEGIREIAGH